MATIATALTDPRLLSAEEFLQIDFGSGLKAELSNGVIRMMAGGSVEHSRVQGNVFRELAAALRGSGCRPHGSDLGVRTRGMSVRYPDVSVWCGKDGAEHDRAKSLSDPRMIVEVLSPSTRDEDLGVKLVEYRALPALETILFVDPADETVLHVQRTGTNSWNDVDLTPQEDVVLPQFGIVLRRHDIFARD